MNLFNKNVRELEKLLNIMDNDHYELFETICNEMIRAYRNGNKVIFLGNGGSMAQAKHLAAELAGKFMFHRPALFSIALDNEAILTAVGNDYTYDYTFERMIEAYCEKGDVIIGLTTSGNSKNVIQALSKAKEIGAFTVALTGKNGGLIKNIADVSFIVPSNSTPRIQEVHLIIGHSLCEYVELNLFKK